MSTLSQTSSGHQEKFGLKSVSSRSRRQKLQHKNKKRLCPLQLTGHTTGDRDIAVQLPTGIRNFCSLDRMKTCAGPTQQLYSVCLFGSSRRANQQRALRFTDLLLMPRISTSWAVSPLPLTSSWCAEGQFYFTYCNSYSGDVIKPFRMFRSIFSTSENIFDNLILRFTTSMGILWSVRILSGLGRFNNVTANGRLTCRQHAWDEWRAWNTDVNM
jgi:hypothetical protein